MEIWSETAWYVQLIFNVLLLVLPTLIGLAVVSAGGAKVVDTVRMLAKSIRPAIDEPTDPLVALLAERTGRRPETVRDFLTGNLDQIVALLPQEAVK